jgi:hypothetical protein
MDPFASSFSEHDDGEADVYMSKEEIIEELALQKTFLASLEDMPDGPEKAEQQRGYQKEIDTLNQRLRRMNAVERSSSASNRAGGGLGDGQRYGSLASTQRASDPFAGKAPSDDPLLQAACPLAFHFGLLVRGQLHICTRRLAYTQGYCVPSLRTISSSRLPLPISE